MLVSPDLRAPVFFIQKSSTVYWKYIYIYIYIRLYDFFNTITYFHCTIGFLGFQLYLCSFSLSFLTMTVVDLPLVARVANTITDKVVLILLDITTRLLEVMITMETIMIQINVNREQEEIWKRLKMLLQMRGWGWPCDTGDVLLLHLHHLLKKIKNSFLWWWREFPLASLVSLSSLWMSLR